MIPSLSFSLQTQNLKRWKRTHKQTKRETEEFCTDIGDKYLCHLAPGSFVAGRRRCRFGWRLTQLSVAASTCQIWGPQDDRSDHETYVPYQLPGPIVILRYAGLGADDAVQPGHSLAQSAGLLPFAMSYNAAISACEKGEQWQQALDLFVVEQSVELLPDVITCNTSIVCEKRERWQQALGLLGSPDAFPNSVTHSAAISACEKGEQLQQAVEL